MTISDALVTNDAANPIDILWIEPTPELNAWMAEMMARYEQAGLFAPDGPLLRPASYPARRGQ